MPPPAGGVIGSDETLLAQANVMLKSNRSFSKSKRLFCRLTSRRLAFFRDVVCAHVL
jgi:hypothetical protein